MKIFTRYRLLGVVLGLSLLLVACAPVRQGVSWADLTVVEDGQILVSYRDYMVLIDPANGRPVQLRNSEGEIRTDEEGVARRWEVLGRDTGSEFFTTPIWLDDETLLVADYNNKFLEVSFQLAEVRPGSQVDLGGHVIADVVGENDVYYVPFSEQGVAAYDIASGEQLWLFETERGVWSSPILIEDRLYFGTMDHQFHALDAETGDQIWSLDLGGAIGAAPLYADGIFYVGTFNRTVFAVNDEGEILADFTGQNWFWNTPVLFDDILYVADLSGRVYALDSETLEAVWTAEVASEGIRPSPLVTDEYVIVADRGGNVYWLERPTGIVIEDFTQSTGAEILSDIILVEREQSDGQDTEPLVVVSTVDGNRLLKAFTLDGVEQWTYDR